jgi:predicted O-linked N-acetylglucosamine transferase (SPINDLY family)
MADYFATLGLADLALDTLPYNGHSTTADLLRAGVPVVTTQGQAYQARVSQSLLHSVGLDELVAKDDEAYVALAIRLASNHVYREEIRNRLATGRQTSALFDPVRMTRNLERAYLSMLDRARSGLPPEHFDLT